MRIIFTCTRLISFKFTLRVYYFRCYKQTVNYILTYAKKVRWKNVFAGETMVILKFRAKNCAVKQSVREQVEKVGAAKEQSISTTLPRDENSEMRTFAANDDKMQKVRRLII